MPSPLTISSGYTPQTPAQQAVKAQKAREVSEEFEAFFMYQVLDLTMPDLSKDSNIGGGSGEAAFHDILNEHVGREIAESGGIGIADAIYDQLIKLQEEGVK